MGISGSHEDKVAILMWFTFKNREGRETDNKQIGNEGDNFPAL